MRGVVAAISCIIAIICSVILIVVLFNSSNETVKIAVCVPMGIIAVISAIVFFITI